MSASRANFIERATNVVRKRRKTRDNARIKGVVRTRCLRGPDRSEVVWEDVSQNIIVNQGLDYLIDVAIGNDTQIATWWCGIIYDTPTVSATGTMASHAGWTEVTVYSAAARPEFKDLDNGVGSRDNNSTTSVAAYTLESSITVGGVILVSTNTKGGTLGTLFSGVAFSGGNRAVQTDDRLEVTYTLTVADDGA